MSGTIKHIAGHVITLADDTNHTVFDGKITVTLNGHPADFGALLPGDSVSLSGNPVTGIAATRKH